MNDQELKDLINRIDQKLYILNEVTFDKLCDLKEEFTKLKQHFVPEQFTEVKVSMDEMMDMLTSGYSNLLEVESKILNLKGQREGPVKVFKNPLLVENLCAQMQKEQNGNESLSTACEITHTANPERSTS